MAHNSTKILIKKYYNGPISQLKYFRSIAPIFSHITQINCFSHQLDTLTPLEIVINLQTQESSTSAQKLSTAVMLVSALN